MSGNVAIEAMAYEIPTHRVLSSWIEDQIADTMARLGVPKGTLETLTGIKERLFWDRGVMPSDVAARAAQRVIADAGIDPKQIGVIINASVCKDYIEPSVASMVHAKLGLSPDCMNYDISNACLGFLNAMETVSLMIEAGQIEYGLIVDGEDAREFIEATIRRLQQPDVDMDTFYSNFATLTLGSGAVAMLLCHKDKATSGHILGDAVKLAATEHNSLCFGQRDFLFTDAKALLVAGVDLAARTWKIAGRKIMNWSDATIDKYIPHQVSQANTQALIQKLGLTLDKFALTFPELGNIGPASLPITLAIAAEKCLLKAGDHVALLGIGSGLNCAMMSVKW